jgi:hypothetical protein
MKTILRKLSVLFVIALSVVACHQDIAEENINADVAVEAKTRAAESKATHYYWYNGEKIELTASMSQMNVIMADDASSKSLSGRFEIEQNSDLVNLKSKSTLTTKEEYDRMVSALKQDGQIRHVLPFFERGEGVEPIGTSDIFYVELKKREI